MYDVISNYRFVRLLIHPHTTDSDYSWALLAGQVLNGIPNGHIIARGESQIDGGLDSTTRIWEVIEELARSGLGRA
jgi:hypothetical protein